ncbi:MAG: hypothetical protein LUG88_00545 [Clostridia bacterium]|nr:hypothetical protein [Clostridia bacterium]
MKNIKAISFLLAVLMTLSSFTISAFAFDENGSNETTIQFTENDLHELVQYDEAVENGHISRMKNLILLSLKTKMLQGQCITIRKTSSMWTATV